MGKDVQMINKSKTFYLIGIFIVILTSFCYTAEFEPLRYDKWGSSPTEAISALGTPNYKVKILDGIMLVYGDVQLEFKDVDGLVLSRYVARKSKACYEQDAIDMLKNWARIRNDIDDLNGKGEIFSAFPNESNFYDTTFERVNNTQIGRLAQRIAKGECALKCSWNTSQLMSIDLIIMRPLTSENIKIFWVFRKTSKQVKESVAAQQVQEFVTIGSTMEDCLRIVGQPIRVSAALFGREWYIYVGEESVYLENGKVANWSASDSNRGSNFNKMIKEGKLRR
jgi:hypothetical protein